MGRFLTVCTLVADVLGLGASYSLGAFFFPWLGKILPDWLLWLRSFCSYLYDELVHLIALIPHIPQTFPVTLARHPGLTWCIFHLMVHLWYVARHFSQRYHETDLAKPRPGAPGGRRWETVQRRYLDYREALGRFRPAITLKTPPTFRFFTRKPERQKVWFGFKTLVVDARGELEWRGHLLIIGQALLAPDRQQDLAPGLAHQLAYYNSDDLWYRAFLDCYPDSFSLFQLISGVCLWLPTLVKTLVWPVVYWRKRILAADRFAFYCGQGYALYQQLRSQGNEAEWRPFWSPEPLCSERVEQLEALLGSELAWKEKQGIAPAQQAAQASVVQVQRQ